MKVFVVAAILVLSDGRVQFGQKYSEVVVNLAFDDGRQAACQIQTGRFYAEDDDLFGGGVELGGQVEQFEDVDFMEGKMAELFDGADLVGGKSAEGAWLFAHFGAVDEDNFVAVFYLVKKIHSAGAAVVKFNRVKRDSSFLGLLLQSLHQCYPNAFVSHQGIAQADHDSWWMLDICHITYFKIMT